MFCPGWLARKWASSTYSLNEPSPPLNGYGNTEAPEWNVVSESIGDWNLARHFGNSLS